MVKKIPRIIYLLPFVCFVGCSDFVVPNQSLGEKLPSLSMADMTSAKPPQVVVVHEWPKSLYRAFPKNVTSSHPRKIAWFDSVINMPMSELKEARLDFTGYSKEPTLKAKWANLELIRRYFHTGRYDDAVGLLEDEKFLPYFAIYLAVIYENEGKLREATGVLTKQRYSTPVFCRPYGELSNDQMRLPLYLLFFPDVSPTTYYDRFSPAYHSNPFTRGDRIYKKLLLNYDKAVNEKKMHSSGDIYEQYIKRCWPKMSTQEPDFISNYFFPECVNDKH